MSKILHFADLHIGAYVGLQCDSPYERTEGTRKCLDVVVSTAQAEGPDLIIVAGDVFHVSRTFTDRSMTEIRIAIDYLSALGRVAPVMVLFGTPNHDNIESFRVMEEYFAGTKYPYVRFFAQPELITTDTRSGPIQVAGLPGFDKGRFRAQFPGLSAEEENQVFTQQLSQIVQGLSAQLDPAIHSVLMAHHTVVGCELDNGTHVFQANEVVLDAATLDNSAFDLVCLGHIHKRQQVTTCNKPVYYSGSIDASTFNDEGHLKGFYIHYVNDPVMGHGTSHNFKETPARKFSTIRLNQDNLEFINTWMAGDYAGSGLVKQDIEDQVVRILYTCDSETEKALDKKKLERDLYAAGVYYVSEIRPEKVTASVNRDGMTEKMTEKDCLERYLLEKKIENPDPIMLEGLNLISEAQASSPVGTTPGLFLPVEIEVRNYRSYAEEQLSFTDIFFAMVNGKNGSGKSSLFMDAITDCLYEETREKDLTGWIRNGEKSGSVSFIFSLGEDTWRVTRTRQRSGKATLALALRYNSKRLEQFGATSNDVWEDHSCERMTDTQQKIIDLLGMDCDTFQSCVLIMQDRYGKFMEASKDDRMAVLANLLGLGIYDELSKIAKDKLTDANREIRTIKFDIEKLESDVSTEEDFRTEVGQVEVSLAVANDDLKTVWEGLTEYQAQLAALDGFVREIETLSKEVDGKLATYNEKKSKKTDLENRVSETESFLQNEQNILDRCAELDSTRMEIVGLDGKLKLLDDKKAQCGKANRELLADKHQREMIAQRLTTINRFLLNKESLEKLVEGNAVETELEEYSERFARYQALNTDLQGARVKASNHAAETVSHCRLEMLELESLQQQVLMLDNSNCIDVEKAGCRFLQSAKNAQKGIDVIKERMAAYETENSIKTIELNDIVDNLLNEVSALAYDAQIHNELKQKSKIYRETKDELAKLAADSATADALNKQDFDLIDKIQRIENDIDALSFDIKILEQETTKHSELVTMLNSLLKYENLKMQLPKAKQFVESSREQIEQLSADAVALSEEIEKQNTRLVELHGLTGNREVLRQCIRDGEQSVKVMETDISTLNRQIGNINAKLEVIGGQRRQLQVRQSELQQVAKKSARLTVLSEAFSQDGIPYQIIRDIVPELEAAANEILGQMTGGKMRLEFVTEKVLKSNKAKEIATLEIIITDIDNGVLPYLSRSGGQKVRAALAVSFALANIKASRVGLQLGMMFVDEPPFLDADGVEAYCAALEIQHNKCPNMRLVAISHDENMKARFPQQIRIDMTENGSKVRR